MHIALNSMSTPSRQPIHAVRAAALPERLPVKTCSRALVSVRAPVHDHVADELGARVLHRVTLLRVGGVFVDDQLPQEAI